MKRPADIIDIENQLRGLIREIFIDYPASYAAKNLGIDDSCFYRFLNHKKPLGGDNFLRILNYLVDRGYIYITRGL